MSNWKSIGYAKIDICENEPFPVYMHNKQTNKQTENREKDIEK